MSSEKKKKARLDTEYILEEVAVLAGKVVETDDYRHYQKCLKKLNDNPELFADFNEFRRKNLNLRKSDAETLYAETAKLQEKYKNILMDPVVTDFLTAEQRINKLLRKMYDCIAANIPIDVSYME